METISSAPTIKQRRKFERIETSDMNNQDTSSINHVSDVETIGKLSKCVHEEVQMLADCCKESIKKFFLREKIGDQRRLSDPISHSSIRENHPNMYKTLLYVIVASPLVISFVTFSTIYATCIYKSQTKPSILYISDIALNYPESSFFAFSLCMIAITVLATISLRHLTLHQYLQDYGQERIKKSWINIMFWDNSLIFFGLIIIGVFPGNDFIGKAMHFAGALLFFLTTTVMCITQTIITYYTINVLSNRLIYYLRLCITILVLISAVAALISGIISWYQFKGENYQNWHPSDGGWTHHVISVIAEWLFVFFTNLYVISFVYELRSCIFYLPIVKITYLTVKEKNGILVERSKSRN